MDNITKGLAQAYRSMYEAKGVERASWVPESITDEDASHFMGAAAAASKAGKSHFEFGGKKYKVTMKKAAAKKISEAEEACDDCGKVHEGSCNEDVKESTEMNENTMHVDIDHMGGHDPHAKKHKITLAPHNHGHYAIGTKKNLQKYLPKHYGSHSDAKAQHPSVFKESTEELDEISLGLATKTYAARKSQAQGAAHQGSRDFAKKQMAKARKTKSFIQKREETEVEESLDIAAHKKAAAFHASKVTTVGKKWGPNAAGHDNAAKAHQHVVNMHTKFGANHSGTKDAVKAAKHASSSIKSMKESPEQPRAKGEKDFKDMHKVNMGADEDELHKKDMEAIKKSVDAIKKKPQPKGNA
jgi:hypothetical protein